MIASTIPMSFFSASRCGPCSMCSSTKAAMFSGSFSSALSAYSCRTFADRMSRHMSKMTSVFLPTDTF